MPLVRSSFPYYFTGREAGTEVSSGNYSGLKVLGVPGSAKCSLSAGGQTEDGVWWNKDMWVVVSCLIKHLAKQTFHLFSIRNLIRCER